MISRPDPEAFAKEAFSRGAGLGAAAGLIIGLVFGAGIVLAVHALMGW